MSIRAVQVLTHDNQFKKCRVQSFGSQVYLNSMNLTRVNFIGSCSSSKLQVQWTFTTGSENERVSRWLVH
jgi:hypothetical protein